MREFLIPFAIFGIIFCIMIYYVVTRFLKSYLKSQIHILELLVTLVVGQLPALFISSWVKFEPDEWFVFTIVCVFIPFLLVLAGSLWGLACARKLGEQRTWPRLGLMASGWGLVVGTLGIVVFPCATLALIGEFRDHARLSSMPKELIWTWFISLCAMLLAIPGLLINRRCKRQAKNPS